MITVNGIAIEYGCIGRVTSPTSGVLCEGIFFFMQNRKTPYLWGWRPRTRSVISSTVIHSNNFLKQDRATRPGIAALCIILHGLGGIDTNAVDRFLPHIHFRQFFYEPNRHESHPLTPIVIDRIKRSTFLLAAVFALIAASTRFASAEGEALYQDAKAPLEKRVDDLFGRLDQNEKLGLLGGTGFTTQPIPRLGVPAMAMADAGQGVRGGANSTLGPATAFPAGVLMASTWDTNLLWQIGQAIGTEARNKGSGIQIELGPAVNIHRNPLGGRDAEYLTEDPYLAARLCVSYIQGMQSAGVAACVKHFAANNQETDRFEVNEDIGERALREIYFPAFEAAVKEGKVWAVMSSYTKVNGQHASANSFLVTDVLKGDSEIRRHGHV